MRRLPHAGSFKVWASTFGISWALVGNAGSDLLERGEGTEL